MLIKPFEGLVRHGVGFATEPKIRRLYAGARPPSFMRGTGEEMCRFHLGEQICHLEPAGIRDSL